MSAADLGESLVGAYMRHVEQCSIVLYNSFFADQQGEIDVVAVKPRASEQPRLVYLCEVTTHIGGMAGATVKKVPTKLGRLREFAELTFPGDEHRFQWWSPYVKIGATTAAFEQLRAGWATEGRSLEFILNEEYTERVTQLVNAARRSPRRPTSRRSGCCRCSPTSVARSPSCERARHRGRPRSLT